MYAHRMIQTLNSLHVQFDLPPEFANCERAEIIVLPASTSVKSKSWTERVLALAGTLSDDFPDDITDEDLGEDAPREELD